NRYSYCLNNPLLYTDPSGEWFGIDDLLIAAVGFAVGYVGHGISTGNWGWSAIAAGGMGAASAWLGYNTAGLATGAITNATWTQVGSMGISAVANQIMPTMYIPIGSHFGLGISPGFGLGASGLIGSINVNGVYTNGDFSIGGGIGIGSTYWGWNASTTYKGYGIGYGQTYYGSSEVMEQQFGPQRVGTYTAFFNHNSFSISNDLWGDKEDRWRTSAAELTIGKWSVGTYLYTNWGEKDSEGAPNISKLDDNSNCVPPWPVGKNKNEGKGTWWNGRVYSAPLWVGYRHGNQITRMGLSHQTIHNLTQNLVHKGFGNQNYYMSYDEFRGGGYFYTGYRSPFSLWDY
ncbi:hypothetical protein LJB98_06280, partial [Bacteroidales bacterium OttesenSCG-928-M11]|nr:hypothetical protein [Bacteroidales bacterium OttesenSCG-928-M11]